MGSKKYYEEINIARGIAILLVVIGHGLSDIYEGVYSTGWCSTYANYFFILIYSFHMPLFIFLSGFVNASVCNQQGSRLTYLRKKFCRLMVPYLVWGILYVFLDIIVGNYTWKEFSIGNYLKHWLIYGDNANWQLWTLYTLFLCSIFSMILFDLLKLSPMPVMFVAGILSAAYLLASAFLPLPMVLYRTNVSNMLIYYVFFIAGIISRKSRLLDRKRRCSIPALGILLLVLAANAALGTYLSTAYELDWNLTKIIGAALGVYCILRIAQNVSKPQMKKIWNCLSSYSMSIYLLANICQDFVRIFVRRQIIPQQFLVLGLLISVLCGIIIPILIDKYIISRSRLLSFLVLGKDK